MRRLWQLSKGNKGDRHQIDEIMYAKVGGSFECMRMGTRQDGGLNIGYKVLTY